MTNRRGVVSWMVLGLMAALFFSESAGETVARGDFELFLDSAAFRRVDGGAVAEVYLRIRNSGLRFKELNGGLESRVRLTVAVVDSTGRAVVSESEEVNFREAGRESAESPLRFQTVIKRYELEAGTYRLRCVAADLYSPKVSLVGLMKGGHKAAVVEGYPIVVPEFPGHALSVSDPKFLWEIGKDGSRSVYHPNPPRLYGLYRDSLRVYVESYVPDSLSASGGFFFGMEILDGGGAVIKEAALTLPEGKRETNGGLVTYPILVQEDINTLKAGSYALYLTAGLSDQLFVRKLAGGFSIAWDLRTWEVCRRSYIEEARFLLSDQDFDEFEKLSMGEQEKALQDMWKKLDPDPSTGVNEAYREFLLRLEYVNANYSDYQTGLFSDRGLIYLKYGPPDEVEVDVVPKNRESLSDAMQKIEDKFHPVNYSNTGASRLKFARPGDNIFVDPRRLGMVGEQGDVGYPYELWTYNGGGAPILERDRGLEPDIGMRFIFVDTEGYGRYKLETSSTLLNK